MNGRIVGRSLVMLLYLICLFGLTGRAFAKTEIPVLIPQQHPVIMEIIEGIDQEFLDLGYSSDDLSTAVRDAQGVQANFSTMIDAAVQERPPVIITVTTGLSKTAVDQVQGRLPVVFSGVTDPVGAGIVEGLESHGAVTGTSDVWPVMEQLRLLQQVVPDAKKVGVLFRPSEPNSQFGIRLARAACDELGLELVERGVEDQKEIDAVLDAILPQVDAVYIGPDNMTIESAKLISEKCLHAGRPVFGGETGTLEKGAVGVVSIEYFDLGRETAGICERILKGSPASEIPVFVAREGFIRFNYDAAYQLGITIPESLQAESTNNIGTYREPVQRPSVGLARFWYLVAVPVGLLLLGGLFLAGKRRNVDD